MISTSIPFDLTDQPSPSGNDTVSAQKSSTRPPVVRGAGASLPPEDKASVSSFRREMAHTLKSKGFSTDGHPASPTKDAVALAGSASPVAETAKNPKKPDSKKASTTPAAVLLPAMGDVWAGFVLPPVPGAPHSQTDAASATLGNQTASTHQEKTLRTVTVENSSVQAPPHLPVIPLKDMGAEKSAWPSVENSPSSSSASILPPTDRVETMAGVASVLGQSLTHGQKGKVLPGAASAGKALQETTFQGAPTVNKGESDTGAAATTEGRFTDKAGKIHLGGGSGADTISVQPPLSTASPSTNSFVSLPPLPTAISDTVAVTAVTTPSAPALSIGTSGWQAALASRAGILQPGQSLLVRTDPAELGPIQVEATLRAGQGEQGNGLHIQLTVKHPGTARMLQQGAPVITQMITTAGAGAQVSVGVTMVHSEQTSSPAFSFSQGNSGQGNPGRSAPDTPFGGSASSTSSVELKMAEPSPASQTKGFESWV